MTSEPSLWVRIHRGAEEIGGNCVEVECAGERLVLDLGLPLGETAAPLPDIPELSPGAGALRGVLISHGHADHCGLLNQLADDVPVYMGAATERILAEAAFYQGRSFRSANGHLDDASPFSLGPFRITPILVDHSAFDSYALLIEGAGRRLFYSGDLRGHGRTSGRFRELLRRPPRDVDVLMLEGTRLGRDEAEGPADEGEVEERMLEVMERAEGAALVAFSPQNVDRLVSVYRASRRAGRDLVVDLYAASVAAATGRTTIPQPHWDNVRVYLPRSQRSRIKRSGEFSRVNAVRSSRIYPDELRTRAGDLTILVRPSLLDELEEHGSLERAEAIFSLWPGYLMQTSTGEFARRLAERGIPLTVAHTSGHASVEDLRRLAEALSPARVVPIHTDRPERFAEIITAHVELRPNGEWWAV